MRPLLLSALRVIVLLPSYTLVLWVRLLKWLIAPLALWLQLLIGVPLVLLRMRQPLRPRFIPIQEADLPDAAWIEFVNAAEALAADGFTGHGDFRCNDLIQNAVLWLRLLSQPEQGISAIAAHIEYTARVRPAQNFIEFATEFSDHRVLSTTNLNMPYSLPAPGFLARLQLKDVWEPRALYVLHRDLTAALTQTVNWTQVERAAHDPAEFLTDRYTREIQALIAQGWLQRDPATGMTRLSPGGAITSVWHQAWPLASLYLRAADRRARRLLAEHGITVEAFTGAAPDIRVAHQSLPAQTPIATLYAGYEHVWPLAQCTDPRAVLEAALVELDRDDAGTVLMLEFRYAFRSYTDQNQRRIRLLRGFDILLDPEAGTLTVTAMERESEQVPDEAEWADLTNRSPLVPLRLEPRLCDLDQVLPIALATFDARIGVGRAIPDSASLYNNEDGIPCWQMVAWTETDQPLHVTLNARTGAVLDE